jgi:vancomycin aglycone glucosyltransferase
MRVLLSTIGSRGDVQPLVALAQAVSALGEEVLMCVPPDFKQCIDTLGISVTPIGPGVRNAAADLKAAGSPPSPERLRQLAEATVATQFETITTAARGCDVLVGATALQIAAPSVAERMGIPYVFAAFCPTVLPSPHHPPIVLRIRGERPAPPAADNRDLWAEDSRRWNETWGALLNAHRTAAGLDPVDDVRSHIFTDRPWLASDRTLGPWPDPKNDVVFQTGAWILNDERPLTPELERFLDAGEPPIYFGLGSMHAPQELGAVMVQAARALGRRAIVLRGWAELSSADGDSDCLTIGEVNQQALFRRVVAAVHHGGAGTTTAAAMAGAPQVVIPQMYDQHYWARRVEELGIGIAHARGLPSLQSLAGALENALNAVVAERARSLARRMRSDGARIAAQRLITWFG